MRRPALDGRASDDLERLWTDALENLKRYLEAEGAEPRGEPPPAKPP